MTQLAITARDNKNLFSNYYLDNQLKNNPEWKKEDHKAAFSPLDRRVALVEQAKALHSEYLGAPGAENIDRINRIDRINASDPVNPVHPVQL